MKKLMLTLGLIVCVCTWMNAELTDAQMQESKDRVEKIKAAKAELADVKTDVADIDAFKDAIVDASEDVIKSGDKMAELYAAWKNGQLALQEVKDFALQVEKEGKKVEDATKKAEPAGKAAKGLKNPKALASATKAVTKITKVGKMDGEEVAFQAQVAAEMLKLVGGN